MVETSARLLRLLSLLQSAPQWTGPELASRLNVSTRTVRNDIERLRSLGYPVDAVLGTTGGYRLGAGATLPPLLLEDDEAVAMAVGLRLAATGGVTGIEESSLQALRKLEQVLPSRLRHRVTTIADATVSIPRSEATVDGSALTAIARAIGGNEGLRFDYESSDGTQTRRAAEPYRLAHTRGRWYLVAWDTDRSDWRTYRVDRMRVRTPNGPRFTPRSAPDGDLVTYLEKSLGSAGWRYRARLTVHAPAEKLAGRLPPAVLIEPLDRSRCTVHVGSDGPKSLALWVGMIDEDFEVDDGTELIDRLRALAKRYARASAATAPEPPVS